MDTYDLTNPRFVIEYSDIWIRPSQDALHCCNVTDGRIDGGSETTEQQRVVQVRNEDRMGNDTKRGTHNEGFHAASVHRVGGVITARPS